LPTRRFDGTDLEEVLEQVRAEAGPEAHIVEANKVRSGGVAGFFAKERFEVVVDLPREEQDNAADHDNDESETMERDEPGADAAPPRSIEDLADEVSEVEQAAARNAVADPPTAEAFRSLLSRMGVPPPSEGSAGAPDAAEVDQPAQPQAAQPGPAEDEIQHPRPQDYPRPNMLTEVGRAERAGTAGPVEPAASVPRSSDPVAQLARRAYPADDYTPGPGPSDPSRTGAGQSAYVRGPSPEDVEAAAAAASESATPAQQPATAGYPAVPEDEAESAPPPGPEAPEAPPEPAVAASPPAGEGTTGVPPVAPPRMPSLPGLVEGPEDPLIGIDGEDVRQEWTPPPPRPPQRRPVPRGIPAQPAPVPPAPSASWDADELPPEEEPAAAWAEPEPPRAAPRVIRRPSGRTREPAADERGVLDQLRRLGLPEEWIPDRIDPANPAPDLLRILEGLPKAPPAPRTTGTVLAICGERLLSLWLARQLAGEMRLDPHEIVITSTVQDEATANHVTLDTTQLVIEQRLSWRRRPNPTLVVVDARPGSAELGWAKAVLTTLEPSGAWGVVDAGRKPEDIESWADDLGGLDALLVEGLGATTSPATVLRVGIPTARLDGRPADPAAWAALLSSRLTSGG
jgi:hypothetical protein